MERAEADPAGRAGEDLGWSIGVLWRSYGALVGAVIDDLPHGARGFQTLVEVIRGGRPSQLALAAHLGIDRTVMTYLIDDLVEAGLVERRPNPDDRRQRVVVATARGEQVLAALRRRVAEAENVLLGALRDDEAATLRGLLSKAACGITDLSQDTDPCRVVLEALGELRAD